MAPLPFSESVFRLPPPHSVKLAASAAIHQLGRLRGLVYFFLGTAAVFGLGFLIWKLGSLFRQFTRGRILRERKPVETRYIKTWFGWIPQDRYETRKKKWKRLCSNLKDWLSWDGNEDYSKLWWDPDHGGDQIRRERKLDSFRAHVRKTSSLNRVPEQSVINPITTQQEMPAASTTVDTYDLSHQPSSAYLTHPLCLKAINQGVIVDHRSSLLVPRVDSMLLGGFRGHTSIASQASMDKNLTRSIVRKPQKLDYFREWATRLELGSLQSILPHQSGTLGRPGSPLISSSSGSDHQIDSCGKSLPQMSPTRITVDENDSPRKVQLVTNATGSLEPNFIQIHLNPDQGFSKTHIDEPAKVLDVECRFAGTLHRHLEWLANECRPGQRGFKFPILPKNWVNSGKWLVYTHPCGASLEHMRRYAQCDFQAGEDEDIDQKSLATVHRRRVNIESIESWRVAINKARRHHDMARVRSVEIFTSSTDGVSDTVIDPANWILRRPPQGFEMPSRQKTAYWYGGTGGWAKLEEWQGIGELKADSANVCQKRIDVFPSSEEAQREFLRNHVEIACQ